MGSYLEPQAQACLLTVPAIPSGKTHTYNPGTPVQLAINQQRFKPDQQERLEHGTGVPF